MSPPVQTSAAPDEPRDTLRAVWRGILGRCPNCNRGRLFRAYLKVADQCPVCGEELHHQRADDAPPYVTMFVVGHIVVALVLAVEFVMQDVPFWLEAMVFSVLTIVLSLALLPLVKGAFVGLQWGLRMHGFGGAGHEADA